MRKCAFCSTDAVKRGGEHIWDDWLNRALPSERFRVKQRLSHRDAFKEYDRKVIKEKLPVVCEKCNNTWMSDLTGRVKDHFQDAIINGTSLSFAVRDTALLAAFAFMKAVVADHAIQKDYPCFTRTDRERFRESLTIPSGVQMWIAAYQGVKRYSGRCCNAILTPNEPSPFYGIEFYSFTYVVGQLALQVHAARWKHIHRRIIPLPVINPHDQWRPAAIRFWPSDGSTFSWPPSKYLGDNIIEAFINRLSLPIRMRIA
jgi:hypothetical protein